VAGFNMSKHIDAPVETVFRVFSDLPNAAGRCQGIKKLEMLTPGPVGAGSRFRETRVVFGREATEEMYVSEFQPPHRYDVRCESCGAAYHTMFAFRPDGSGTMVDMTFDIQAISFFAKLMKPLSGLMMGPMKKCMEQDLTDLKKFAEANATSPSRAGVSS
jgi:hypothetical protein